MLEKDLFMDLDGDGIPDAMEDTLEDMWAVEDETVGCDGCDIMYVPEIEEVEVDVQAYGDIDGDGIVDSVIYQADTDGDGNIDWQSILTDTNDDGVYDAEVRSMDIDGDGIAEVFNEAKDTNFDGRFDAFADSIDENHDGYEEYAEGREDSNFDGTLDRITYVVDTDGDGYVDTISTDSDGNYDSIFDGTRMVEDTDKDGVIDHLNDRGDLNGDNRIDIGRDEYKLDLDGDGKFDQLIRYVDVDGDGTYDTYEEYNLDDKGRPILQEEPNPFEAPEQDAEPEKYEVVPVEPMDDDSNTEFPDIFTDDDNDLEVEDLDDESQDENDIEDEENPENETQEDESVLHLNTIDYDSNADNGMYYEELDRFNPADADKPGLFGDPEESMEYWECQGNTNRCALYAQKFIIEEVTGQEIDIEDLVDTAEQNNWFNEQEGTPILYMDKMLDEYGIEHTTQHGGTIEDIQECLNDGGNVIVAVDAGEYWYGENDQIFTPGEGPDHAVEVIGIDNSDPENPMVILNDSGVLDGSGLQVPLDTFLDAWEDGGNFMIACE